ncbi:MAG: hypothetical protein RLZZ507_1265 [Cyanobacteriota bacterium]|jgi:hypothetical protein
MPAGTILVSRLPGKSKKLSHLFSKMRRTLGTKLRAKFTKLAPSDWVNCTIGKTRNRPIGCIQTTIYERRFRLFSLAR